MIKRFNTENGALPKGSGSGGLKNLKFFVNDKGSLSNVHNNQENCFSDGQPVILSEWTHCNSHKILGELTPTNIVNHSALKVRPKFTENPSIYNKEDQCPTELRSTCDVINLSVSPSKFNFENIKQKLARTTVNISTPRHPNPKKKSPPIRPFTNRP